MMQITIMLEVLFWLSVFLIFHSYLIFTAIIALKAKNKKENWRFFERDDDLPAVNVLMSVYNEEAVIEAKLHSILSSNYPAEKLNLYIGSDNSSDKTNKIIENFANQHDCIRFFPFHERQGKSNIINQLVRKTGDGIMILTDANVMFEKDTVFELVKFFKDKTIGLVDANMLHEGIVKDGISIQENTYISREVRIKYNEGLLWGTMMGPFGGCFAIRKDCFAPVPSNFLVDDFYINMQVLQSGYKAINNLQAKVHEDVPNDLKEEFRRKVRIATGNFQNFFYFFNLLFSSMKGLSFCYFSHKVIRWFVPLLILVSMASNILIYYFQPGILYLVLLSGQIILAIIPFIDLLLRYFGLHVIILRFITHFYVMNIALLKGLFKFLGGVKSNVWQPTKRFQSTV